MMIETEVLYAHIKTDDWLKSAAENLLREISQGKHGKVLVSREFLHELYYISKEEGTSLFDAYHAATCLNADPDNHLYLTDQIYDKIPGITRTDQETSRLK